MTIDDWNSSRFQSSIVNSQSSIKSSLPESISNGEFELGTVDHPDLYFPKKPAAVLQPDEHVKSAPGIRCIRTVAAVPVNVQCRPRTDIGRHSRFRNRNPVSELEICRHGRDVAPYADFEVGPEREPADQRFGYEVRTEMELVRTIRSLLREVRNPSAPRRQSSRARRVL